MAKTVADQFAETLAAAGVKRIYGVVGDSLNGLTDSIRRQGKIEWMHVRHEEVAAFAASGEAHVTGELAVCAGSCGPGNLHLINGLFDCQRSRLPVLAIAAQVPSAELGAGYFQETHPENLFKECSNYCELISGANQMPRVLEIAIRQAVGNRGVSVVVIPGDVALQPATDAPPPKVAGLLPKQAVTVPAQVDIDGLAALLNSDGRVTMFCGSGCEGAHDEVLALADRLKAPIVHAFRGKEHVEWDNPFDVGMTGLIGFASGYYAIMVGCGMVMLGLAWLGTYLSFKQRLERNPLLLWLTFLSFPLPFIAILTGWFTAEVGRQPWVVFGVLRTADAMTPFLTTREATISLLIFCAVYTFIFAFGTFYIYRLIRTGPVGRLFEPARLAVPSRPMSPVNADHILPERSHAGAGE